MNRPRNKIIKISVLLILMLSMTGSLYAQDVDRSKDGIAALESIQSSFRAVARKVIPAVVKVDVVDIIKQPARSFGSPFDFFFRRPDSSRTPEEQEFRRPGLGSGVIVRKTDNKVYVLTNNHVAGEAEEISVSLADGREFAATLVGNDPNMDLALIMFETKEDVPIAELGDSDRIQVGDWALAVGNPFGFESTITAGIISAVGRHSASGNAFSQFTDYIQTDAAINQGNSGGPLVDIQGQVIGINTWIASQSGGNIGLGFAIPVNNAKKAIDDFITKGGVDYGWLGIIINLSPKSAEEVASDLKLTGKDGALVYGVFKNAPADKSGILPGDYITAINGKPISDSTGLSRVVANLTAGEEAVFELIRYGKRLKITAEIGSRVKRPDESVQDSNVWPGLWVATITDQIRSQLDLSKSAGNVVITRVGEGSAPDVAGFRPGDVIKKINGKNVKSAMDFYRLINDPKAKDWKFTIFREGTETTIRLKK